MTHIISGFGTIVRLTASSTFPQGIDISSFDDENDPISVDNLQVTDTSQGLNGDLITWSNPNPIVITFSLIADTTDDINLSILLEANRTGYQKESARDEITLAIYYPDNRILTFTSGVITAGDIATSISAAGRKKGKTYSFSFENRILT